MEAHKLGTKHRSSGKYGVPDDLTSEVEINNVVVHNLDINGYYLFSYFSQISFTEPPQKKRLKMKGYIKKIAFLQLWPKKRLNSRIHMNCIYIE